MDCVFLSEQQVNKLSEEYFRDDAKKLKSIINNILKKFNGVILDMDEYYSVGSEYFCEALAKYNGVGNFNGYLSMVLQRKLYSTLTTENRQKRADVRVKVKKDGTKEVIFYSTLSIDDKTSGDSGESCTLSEVIPSSFNMEEEIFKVDGSCLRREVRNYLDSLPKKTRKIFILLNDGYRQDEVCRILHITRKDFNNRMKTASSYEYTKRI